jgi:hypothetical protein
MGFIESRQRSHYNDDDPGSIIQEMREYAGTLGCDALVIVGDNNGTQVTGANGWTTSHSLIGYRASCLVYTPNGG